MATHEEMAAFSGYVYQDDTVPSLPDGWVKVDIPGGSKPETGFFAEAYRNQETGEVVVSFRGTDDLKDFTPDGAIMLQTAANQYGNAYAFYQSVAGNFPSSNISLTGHSLGGAGNDTLFGSSGNDTLGGGSGADGYEFGLGSGQDIVSNQTHAGEGDQVAFGSGISTDQLWFTQSGRDLLVSVIGTGDQVSVQGWYDSSGNHVDSFKTSDGQVLLDSQVDNLVSAMAAFAPPGMGQTTLAQSYQDQLLPIIAANWHS